MNVQYITNIRGKRTAVIVSIEEWRTIMKKMQASGIDLREHGITEEQALELRERLTPFAEDWNIPEMDIYDHYDEAKARL